MKIQKMFFIIGLFILVAVTPTVYGQDIAVKSDIRASIDYTPINSYNIDGYTYIIAEKLNNYGFDVLWDENNRTLDIKRTELFVPVYTKELWNLSSDDVGSLYNIYSTDIKTYLDGNLVNSYNIGGQTVIQFDEFAKYGGFDWNADKREVSATIFQNELQEKFASAENKVEVDYSKDFKTNKYEGQTDYNGNPSGIGLLKTNDYTSGAGVSYGKQDEILGYFENGKPSGNIYLKRFLSAGKTGESENIYFIGTIDGENCAIRNNNFSDGNISNVVREANFGVVALPHHSMHNYIGAETFPDANIYLSGVWCEINEYRGQKGITYRTWKNQDYQTIIETKASDYQGTQITTYFTEYTGGTKTYEENR